MSKLQRKMLRHLFGSRCKKAVRPRQKPHSRPASRMLGVECSNSFPAESSFYVPTRERSGRMPSPAIRRFTHPARKVFLMLSHTHALAVALAAASLSFDVLAAERTEHFDSDPRWPGQNHRAVE